MKAMPRTLVAMIAASIAIAGWTVLVYPQRGGAPGSESGWSTFQNRCAICHSNPGPDHGPSAESIRQLTPEKIYDTLTTGKMKSQTEGLSDAQVRRIAEFMAGRPLGSAVAGAASLMMNKCQNNPSLSNVTQGATWNGWSADLANTRFQSSQAAGLTAAQVPNLKLKWAFGFPKGETSSSQPTIAAGRVFVGSDNGFIYSLDAATGCVYWSFESGSIVRGSLTVGPVTGQGSARYAVFFGDGHANIYGVNAQDGKLLWKTNVDPHVVARITAGTKFYNGKLIVPVSSSEEFSGGSIGYPCCTSRGSVVALDANSGKQLWKAWVIEGDPKPFTTMANGVKLYAPGGGGVWNTPTIDPVRNAVYFGTGDADTGPAPKTTDGVMAVDINTGKTLWVYQADENDVFMGGCGGQNKSEICPMPNGPDLDIGNPPILKTLPGGKRVLLAGTKRGHIFALDPDNRGALLYRVLASNGTAVSEVGIGARGGNIVWGGAADDSNVYYGNGTTLTASRLTNGEHVWTVTGRGTLGAAPTGIPGVVFEGSSSGMLYAMSSTDGKFLWEFNTAQDFMTVNGVPAHGGAINISGAVVVNGQVYVTSGYAISSGASGGNVLLAFGVN
jgi:polyvinyl alcohol dehydrogenase (cytochrome)